MARPLVRAAVNVNGECLFADQTCGQAQARQSAGMVPFGVRSLRQFNAWSLSRQARAPGDCQVGDSRIGGVGVRSYLPARAGGGDVMIYFHGGGSISGSVDTHDSLCSHLAMALGIRLVSVGYRLAPEHPAPAQLDDALAVCAASGLAQRLLLGGDSAGGYLAMRCALALNAGQRDAVAAVLLLNPLVDIAGGADTLSLPGRLATRSMRRLVGRDAYPSLLAWNLAIAPPTVLAWGDHLTRSHPARAASPRRWPMPAFPCVGRFIPRFPMAGLT